MEAAVVSTTPRRAAYGLVALALLGLVAFEVTRDGTWWQAVAFGIGPDIALLLGLGPGLARGQLHPRAVPLYNLLHRFWGPIVLAVPAAVGVLPLVCSLAWALHIALDRTMGYGLRTRDGFQRA